MAPWSATQSMTYEQLESKSIGALLGTFTGDALGMPVEGYDAEMIDSAYGEVTGLLDSRLGLGTYTDDTQMMIGVAESLAECRGLDGEHMAKRFVANFDPERGYGSGALEAIYRLSQGVPWHRAGEKMFGGGSFGNGSAMRVAPVGVFCAREPGKLAEVAEKTATITHSHSLGRGGAVLQAQAVALAFQSDPEVPLDTAEFVGSLERAIRPEWEAFGHKLVHIRELLSQDFSADEVVRTLGNDVTCQGSVPAAIYCFLLHPDHFRDCVLAAVNLGGDTDTIGAMAGALSGARLGYEEIPVEWRSALENGESGRDYVIELGRRLHRVAVELADGD